MSRGISWERTVGMVYDLSSGQTDYLKGLDQFRLEQETVAKLGEIGVFSEYVECTTGDETSPFIVARLEDSSPDTNINPDRFDLIRRLPTGQTIVSARFELLEGITVRDHQPPVSLSSVLDAVDGIKSFDDNSQIPGSTYPRVCNRPLQIRVRDGSSILTTGISQVWQDGRPVSVPTERPRTIDDSPPISGDAHAAYTNIIREVIGVEEQEPLGIVHIALSLGARIQQFDSVPDPGDSEILQQGRSSDVAILRSIAKWRNAGVPVALHLGQDKSDLVRYAISRI
jgi:hypothetical protein